MIHLKNGDQIIRKEEIIKILSLLAEQCNANATKQGFWEDENIILSIINTAEAPTSSHMITKSSRYHSMISRVISLFNSEKIALEMSELAERLETLRKDPTKKDEHCPEFFNIEIECADLIIRCLDFCGRRNLRIGEALIAKMKYNEGREFKHGKNF